MIDNSNAIKLSEAHIIFDLHGVLISKEKMGIKYDNFVAKFLEKYYSIPIHKSKTNIQKANDTWLQYWIKAKKYSKDKLISEYEKINAKWAEIILQGKFCADYRQFAEFLEYYVPTHFCCAFPEVKEEVSKLEEKGLKLSVASSAYTRHTLGTLIGCNIIKEFHKIIGLENTQALKSDLQYYKEAIKILQAKAEEVIFVGNSYNEILLPKKLGAKVIHVDREILDRTKINTIKKQADLVVPDLTSFYEILLNNNLISL